HLRPADQDGYDGNPPGQGRLDLDADEVPGVVQPTLAGLRTPPEASVEPVVPDDRQQHVALAHRPPDLLAEVDPKGERVDVEEDVVAAEVRLDAVVDAAGDVLAVLPAVRDEDLGHGRRVESSAAWVGILVGDCQQW